jgi:hypothetical protein
MARSSSTNIIVSRIVSAGQTGADRGALDWAMEHGIPHGGYGLENSLVEDGEIPERYRLTTEFRDSDSVTGAERNVEESDGTIIFTMDGALSGGALMTEDCTRKYGKPFLHVWARAPLHFTIPAVQSFVADHRIVSLNVAGSRRSRDVRIGPFVGKVFDAAFAEVIKSVCKIRYGFEVTVKLDEGFWSAGKFLTLLVVAPERCDTSSRQAREDAWQHAEESLSIHAPGWPRAQCKRKSMRQVILGARRLPSSMAVATRRGYEIFKR